ncbi:MAG: hypothetical protein RLO21_06655 [Nitratireductor sp.]
MNNYVKKNSSGFASHRLPAALMGGLALIGLASQSVQAKEITFASYLPPSHLMNKEALPSFFKAVTAASNGTITFNHVPGAQLFDNKSSITATGEGLADATNALSAYAPNQLPHFNILFDMVAFVENPLAGNGSSHENDMMYSTE